MTLLQIVKAIDGPPRAEETWVIGLDLCSDNVACPLYIHEQAIKGQIRDTLEHQTMADLAAGMGRKRLELARMDGQVRPQATERPNQATISSG